MPYFEVKSKLNKKVAVTKERWNLIVNVKHPIINKKEKEVMESISQPDEIRVSKTDSSVYLYYKYKNKLSVCSVVKHKNGDGFLITAYLTDRIKEGKQVYKK